MLPVSDCSLCPRLTNYRAGNAAEHPSWHNAPALPIGSANARLLVVGLAPGKTGANRTGIPFNGDSAGKTLFEALVSSGFAHGFYEDGNCDRLSLKDCRITNAVLCAPPENKPNLMEQATCRPYLKELITSMSQLRVIITLGDLARRNVLKAIDAPQSSMTSGHGTRAFVTKYWVLNSYHCSRYNLNTGRLTFEMFKDIFHTAHELLAT